MPKRADGSGASVLAMGRMDQEKRGGCAQEVAAGGDVHCAPHGSRLRAGGEGGLAEARSVCFPAGEGSDIGQASCCVTGEL